MERMRFQIKSEGSPRSPKFPSLCKLTLELRDFELLKSNAAYILTLADQMSASIAPKSIGKDDSPSFEICNEHLVSPIFESL